MTERLIAFLLLIVLAVSLISCGGSDNTGVSADSTTAADTTAQTETQTETKREEIKDNLPADLDFKGQAVRIAYNDDGLASSGSGVNEIEGLENAGDIVNDAVFNRNIKVEERLNIKFEVTAFRESNAKYMNNVRAPMMAGDDVYDIVDGPQYLQAIASIDGLYYNLAKADYLDYDQPWWQDAYMDKMSVNTNERYMLMGDISVNMISNLSAIFYNRQLCENSFGDADKLYETVLSGGWTVEIMRGLLKDVYRDVNSNAVVDPGDILGMGTTTSSPTEHFIYCMGMQNTSRDKDGYPVLVADQTRNVKIFETLYNLFYESDGVYVATNSDEINTVLPTEFIGGNILLFPARLSYAGKFRDMENEYGIITHPKLDETQENYLTLVHDAANAFAIPLSCPDIAAPCAALEAMCAENYRTVTPAYFEVALKVKYTRDTMSAQIIDMIRDGATSDFMYINNYVFSDSKLGIISRTLMGAKNRDYMSAYDAMKTALETKLDQLIEANKSAG
ncbi:MAG: hypothetical protein GX628_07130 [Clostridiales bacterium]|nr:hypothetical protein [Clostridiales bacterium]